MTTIITINNIELGGGRTDKFGKGKEFDPTDASINTSADVLVNCRLTVSPQSADSQRRVGHLQPYKVQHASVVCW